MACIPVNPVGFYVLPDLFGSCLPFEWTLIGPGRLDTGGMFGEIGYYNCAGIDCWQDITITVKDRCETSTQVHAKSCCETAAALSISYTTLLMSCGSQQDLYASNGCGPYRWAISAGGGTLSADTGWMVTYTAPATNLNCTENPTITLTDCCGVSASISMAVNCYTGDTIALTLDNFTQCWCCEMVNCGICGWCSICCGWYEHWGWNCAGVLKNHTYPGGRDSCATCGTAAESAFCTSCGGWSEVDCPPNTRCIGSQKNACCGYTGNFGLLVDVRTQAMKDAGCCPINPLTGLPY